jgi:hypothetical protein
MDTAVAFRSGLVALEANAEDGQLQVCVELSYSIKCLMLWV